MRPLQQFHGHLHLSLHTFLHRTKMIVKLKFMYSEKATKFCEISTMNLTGTTRTVEISQNFVAFSEYMNFNL